MFNPPILHVEDEDASAFLLQAALDQAAIPNRTFRVSSGENALAFLCKAGSYKDAQSPGLVILDLNLPRVDGWTVLATMKRQQDLRSIPVIILSSSDLESDKKRALHLGADQYVVKQDTIAAMRGAILNACAGFMSFQVKLEAGRTYTLRSASVAFESSMDNGVEVNNATLLPESAQVKLIGSDTSSSSAFVRYGSRDFRMSLHDLRDNAVISTATRPDSPEAPYPSPIS